MVPSIVEDLHQHWPNGGLRSPERVLGWVIRASVAALLLVFYQRREDLLPWPLQAAITLGLCEVWLLVYARLCQLYKDYAGRRPGIAAQAGLLLLPLLALKVSKLACACIRYVGQDVGTALGTIVAATRRPEAPGAGLTLALLIMAAVTAYESLLRAVEARMTRRPGTERRFSSARSPRRRHRLLSGDTSVFSAVGMLLAMILALQFLFSAAGIYRL